MALPGTGRFSAGPLAGIELMRVGGQPATSPSTGVSRGGAVSSTAGSRAERAATTAGRVTRRELLRSGRTGVEFAMGAMARLQPEVTRAFEANLESVLPGYKDILAQLAGTVRSQLAGDLPEDVVSQIERFAAEQGVQGGFGGSEIQRRAVARDLGLTSMQVMERGQEVALQMFDVTASRLTAPLVDPQRLTEQFLAYAAPGSVLRSTDILTANAEAARLAEARRQSTSDLAWQRELSDINRRYTEMRDRQERSLFERGLTVQEKARKEELGAYRDISERLITPGEDATGFVPAPTGYTFEDFPIEDPITKSDYLSVFEGAL